MIVMFDDLIRFSCQQKMKLKNLSCQNICYTCAEIRLSKNEQKKISMPQNIFLKKYVRISISLSVYNEFKWITTLQIGLNNHRIKNTHVIIHDLKTLFRYLVHIVDLKSREMH